MDARPNFAKIRENGKKDEGRWRVVKGKILPFTHESPVFIGFSGEQVKGEGKNHFSILNFLCYKGFSKKQNAKQIFSFRQVCKAPKEGHYWAKVRAPLCSGKSTKVPPKSAMVHKSDTTRKPEAQISIFQSYESQTSL